MKNTVDMSVWQGRVDALEGELGARWHQRIAPLSEHSQGVALLGFACDAGVQRNHGRIGARFAPTQVRRFLANIPVSAPHGAPHGAPHSALFDAGNVVCEADALESAQAAFAAKITQLLAQSVFPVGLGGGHEIAYASFGGLAEYLSRNAERAPNIGIINLDAHFDLRLDERASSGTPFLQIANECTRRGWDFRYLCLGVSEFANTSALFARARDLGVDWRLDEQMREQDLPQILAQVDAFIAPLDALYLTIDMDVLPASVAPGVSAPSALGVPLSVVEAVLDRVCASGKLRVADWAEFNPEFDVDGHTARVAARLVARLVTQLVAHLERNDE